MANTTQILKLTCTHDYFPGAMEGLQLMPTKTTRKWVDAHRILMRNLATDITLYKTEETPEDYQELLTFLLLVDDTQFYNYTRLPAIATKDQLCYLTNKDESLEEKSEIDEYHFFDKTYSIMLGEAVVKEEKPLIIKDQAGEIVAETSWNGHTPLFSLYHDLPPGKYDWTYNTAKGSFFGDQGITGQVFGLVEIDLKTAENKTFTIHFKTRASIWEYYIIDKQQTGNNYEIVDEQENYRFRIGEKTEVLGGKQALKIASQNPIPFKQYPDYEFKLVTRVNSGNMIQPWNSSLILPTARSEHLQVFEEQQLRYITPIYIYI